MAGFLRRGPQAQVVPDPWIVRTADAEVRCADLRKALTKAVELLPQPADSSEETIALVIEERRGRRGRLQERLEATLTMSGRGLAVEMNRTYLKPGPYSPATLKAQPPEKIAHLILIEYDKDIVGH